jgi:hypothetical protein
MSYHLLCPQCGRGFLDAEKVVKCPQCGVALERTAPAVGQRIAPPPIPVGDDGVSTSGQTSRVLSSSSSIKTEALDPATAELLQALASDKLPQHVDIDELFRTVLAEQAQGEAIDAALKRVVGREFPDAAGPLCKLLSEQLDQLEQMGAKSRQAAAAQLARSHSELNTGPGGRSEIRTTSTSVETNIGGVRFSRGRSVVSRGLENLTHAQRKLIGEQLVQALGGGKSISMTPISVTAQPLLAATLGVRAPADFCSVALEELEAAGIAPVTERTKRVDQLWGSSSVQDAYNRLSARVVQIAAPLTIVSMILAAAAGLGAGWILPIGIVTAIGSGASAQRFYKQRLRAAVREEIEFPSVSR